MTRSAGSSFSRGGMLSLARLLSGLVRVKIVALALGVGGVGVFALAQQANLAGVSLVSMSLAVPMINLGRPLIAAGEAEQAGRIAGSALTIVIINSIILLLVALLFGPPAARHAGQGAIAPILIAPVVAAVLLGALASSFWEGLSYLSDRFDIYVKAGIVSAIADMIFVGLGAQFFGIRGAIMAMPVAPLILIISYGLLLRRDDTARQVLRSLEFARSELPRLLAYSAIMFAAVGLTNVGLTAARAGVLLHAGAAANGNLQTATSLSAYILAFVTTPFWGHLHAHAAAAGDVAEVRAELNHALVRGLLISFTGCGIAAILADHLLPLFFSHQFSGGAPLVVAYMPGELCFQFLTLLISYQLTVSLRRRYLAWSLGYIALLVSISALAVPRFGPTGYVAGHVFAALIMVILAAALSWRSGQVRGTTLLFAAGLLSLLGLVSSILLLEPDLETRWRFVALLPFAASGVVLASQLLSDMGMLRLPRHRA